MSKKGAAFIRKHEGFVSKAYRCPAGKITIGTGFTNGSKTALQWFKKSRGHKIRMGDRIDIVENDKLLTKAMNEEYGIGVANALGTAAPKHAKDAGTSVSFNCGPGSLKWSWAKLYKAGNIKQSAARLRTTAVTARGRRLRGLVRRRDEEANLLQHGDYGNLKSTPNSHGAKAGTAKPVFSEQLKQDQQMLNSLGYDCGKADGLWGFKTATAVKALQRATDLIVDGILGPATRAKIIRLANAKREVTGVATAGGGTAGGSLAVEDTASVEAITQTSDWILYGGLAVLGVGLAYLAWFYRDEIKSALKRI
ncbi:MAG: lysozyme [Hyphomicrobiales bacterium]|nr:MAG: lysozyme [Hyphomicrobiales bacterium]